MTQPPEEGKVSSPVVRGTLKSVGISVVLVATYFGLPKACGAYEHYQVCKEIPGRVKSIPKGMEGDFADLVISEHHCFSKAALDASLAYQKNKELYFSTRTQTYWYCWDRNVVLPNLRPHHLGFRVSGDHWCSLEELEKAGVKPWDRET